MPKTKLLIDGDILLYQSIAGTERELEFEPGVYILTTYIDDAKDAFKDKLQGLLNKANIDEYVLALSGDKNFRQELYPLYKAPRKSMRKPLGFKDFKLWVCEEYLPAIKPDIEADDVLGILATKPGTDHVIWSIDKDLMQIPGKHLVDGKIKVVTKEEGDYYHLFQTLIGDTTDNYPGCPGIGKVKAEKVLLNNTRPLWAEVVKLFDQAGLTEDDALTQARVARILQWNNWDMETQTVKHWNPYGDN